MRLRSTTCAGTHHARREMRMSKRSFGPQRAWCPRVLALPRSSRRHERDCVGEVRVSQDVCVARAGARGAQPLAELLVVERLWRERTPMTSVRRANLPLEPLGQVGIPNERRRCGS
jgi:hypothetical protein